MERETGFEPATFALARQRSTTELFPRKNASKAYHTVLVCQLESHDIILPLWSIL